MSQARETVSYCDLYNSAEYPGVRQHHKTTTAERGAYHFRAATATATRHRLPPAHDAASRNRSVYRHPMPNTSSASWHVVHHDCRIHVRSRGSRLSQFTAPILQCQLTCIEQTSPHISLPESFPATKIQSPGTRPLAAYIHPQYALSKFN